MWEDVTGQMTFELGLQIGVFQAEEGGNHVALRRRVYVWRMEGLKHRALDEWPVASGMWKGAVRLGRA